jgi:hypothetical protein
MKITQCNLSVLRIAGRFTEPSAVRRVLKSTFAVTNRPIGSGATALGSVKTQENTEVALRRPGIIIEN